MINGNKIIAYKGPSRSDAKKAFMHCGELLYIDRNDMTQEEYDQIVDKYKDENDEDDQTTSDQNFMAAIARLLGFIANAAPDQEDDDNTDDEDIGPIDFGTL